MAGKLGLITDLYSETLKEITNNPTEWMKFLECSAMNYKYPFNDQVLIYAQKPEAVACASVETWNKSVGRWINRGSKGIALISEDRGNISLKYVFDVSDTNDRYGKIFRIWNVPTVYQNDLIESFENKYGILENKEDYVSALKSVSKIIVEDNLQDYLEDLMKYKEDTFLEELDDLNIKVLTEQLLTNTVAFTLIKRSGLNPNEYFELDDFRAIVNFNSFDTITRLGIASSEMSEMGLRDIYTTIKKLRLNEIDKIRTLELKNENKYNVNESEERSDNYENNLYSTRGLRDTKSNIGEQGESNSSNREIRNDEVSILEERKETSIHNTIDERQIDRTLNGDSRTSRDENRGNNLTDEREREYNRELEREEPNEVGINDEQLEEHSRGCATKEYLCGINTMIFVIV